ncbi:MAG: biotin/lipoyl-binding protein [Atopobiaceae bacterium]|jgi:biotin carboxyl carrier protein|nr:biotin/lipoyl-binding protein [Atopobiaceae bacterium]
MLRKFKVNIDGKLYKVELEELGVETPPSTSAATSPKAAVPAAPAAAQPSASAAPQAEPAGKGAQLAPMPGKISDIRVAVGSKVAKNDVVLILEAMKMENEIVAESSGTLVALHVSKGDMVNPGDPLFTIA